MSDDDSYEFDSIYLSSYKYRVYLVYSFLVRKIIIDFFEKSVDFLLRSWYSIIVQRERIIK